MLLPALILPLIVVIAVVAMVAAQRRTQMVLARWRRAASQLGLQVTASGWRPPRMDGPIGGLGVSVDVYTTGSNNSRTHWTRYRATFPEPGIGVRLKRQTGLSRISKLFGATDIEVGDPEFDDAFIVKARTEDRAAQFLTAPRRTLLLRLYSLYRDVNVTEEHVEVITRGRESDVAVLVTNTRRIVSAGRALAGLYDDGGRVERALRKRAAGDMAAAAQQLQRSADPNDVEESITQAEILASSGRADEARPILESLSDRLPADAEVAGLRETLEAINPDVPAPDQTPVEMQEILDDLFVSNRLSFGTARVFDEHYLGREVTWPGRLKSVRDYQHDLDFGEGPGTKLVVAIAQIEHDLYGVAEVDAVLSVAPGVAANLERGDPVRFSGRLMKADGMMRNVFVADAKLVNQ